VEVVLGSHEGDAALREQVVLPERLNRYATSVVAGGLLQGEVGYDLLSQCLKAIEDKRWLGTGQPLKASGATTSESGQARIVRNDPD